MNEEKELNQLPQRKKLNWFSKTIIILNALIMIAAFIFLLSVGLNTKEQSIANILTFAWSLWALIPLLIANLAIHIIVIIKAFRSKQILIGTLLIVAIVLYVIGVGIVISLVASVFFINPPKQKKNSDQNEAITENQITDETNHEEHSH